MAASDQLRDQLIYSKILRPEVLGYDEDAQDSLGLVLPPDDAIDVIRVTLDNPNDFFGDVRHRVIRHFAERALAAARLVRENSQRLHHPLDLETDHHHSRLFHPFRALVHLADVEGRKVEDGRLLVYRAAVGEDG